MPDRFRTATVPTGTLTSRSLQSCTRRALAGNRQGGRYDDH
jgi:hypothetical protein